MLPTSPNLANILQATILLASRTTSIKLINPVIRHSSNSRPQIDRSKVPQLNEKDIEEHFISGSGPGGQSVNKSVNCCQLKHKPTGIVVKCHQTRSLEKNKLIARELLITKLDNLYNGQDSVENQKRRIALAKLATREAQQKRRQALKEEMNKNTMDKGNSGALDDGIQSDPQVSDIDDIYSNKTTS